jgi:hypothetical protein
MGSVPIFPIFPAPAASPPTGERLSAELKTCY